MVLELIENRFSVRKYKDQKVEDEKIKSILNAGRLAPSWMNSQPWHFIVIDNQDKKDLLSEMCLGQKACGTSKPCDCYGCRFLGFQSCKVWQNPQRRRKR
ncbi:MAG: nitroreductase family protein [Candidatus Melainabacteria bacterium]|nr:MAG: nitroreductase family protein [Candidatus Melainabacteria bacterium]